MDRKWIPAEVTNATIKAWVQQGEPPEIWPLTFYDEDGTKPIEIHSPADSLRQTIPELSQQKAGD